MQMPHAMLPEVRSSSEIVGDDRSVVLGIESRSPGSPATSRRRCSVRPASSRAGQEDVRHRYSC